MQTTTKEWLTSLLIMNSDDDCITRNGVLWKSVAGFSQDFPMKSVWATEDQLVSLDPGLNSPYICDIDSLSKRIYI